MKKENRKLSGMQVILLLIACVVIFSFAGKRDEKNAAVSNERENKIQTNKISNKMITVKVTYTVKPEFVEANKQNISIFLDDFKKMNSADFRYVVYLMEDGKTFVHLSHYKNAEVQKEVLNVESFKSFQKKRDDSGLDNTHKVEVLNYIGSSADIF